MIDVLWVDKTGTLTENKLAVTTVRPLAEGWTAGDVLAFAALANSPEGQDPVDVAIRTAALATSPQRPLPVVTTFTPLILQTSGQMRLPRTRISRKSVSAKGRRPPSQRLQQ